MKDLISVLVPVFNKADFIEQTLLSIDSQITRNEFDIELILVDDCSTDNSYELIKNYKFNNKNIVAQIYKNEVNLGSARTLNKALKLSKGSFVTNLDADDLLTTLSLLKRFKALKNNQDYMWVSGSELIISHDGKIKVAKEFVHENINLEFEQMFAEIIEGKFILPNQGLMYKKDLIEKYSWNEAMRSSHDYGLILTFMANGFEPLIIDDYVAIYRSSKDNQENSLYWQSLKSGQKAKDLLALKESIKDKLDANKLALLDRRIENYTLKD